MAYSISRRENRITARDSLGGSHVRSLCKTLYDAIEEKKYPDVTLDFSLCERVFEAFMLPLLPLIVNYREQNKINFNLILPQEDRLKRLFKNANWAHYINPSEYEQSSFEGGNLPALQYKESDEQPHLVDRVMDLVLRHIEGVERPQLKAFEWSLGEITDNVLQHAQSPVGGFVQATVFRENHQVEFVVADCGRGIPASLGMPKDSVKALQRAIEEGVTRDPNSNAGNGLYGSYRVAVLSKGDFEINSGTGHLLKSDKGSDIMRRETIPYAGTSVRCLIDFNDPTLLKDALRLGDKIHDPYDYMTRRYGAEGDESARVSLAEHINDVSSREGGKKVRTQLENLLNSAQRIIIDFEDVSVISSSFADEVFGRLFVKLGPRNFFRRIEFQNTDETADVLIDRAIIQRTQTTQNGNGDNER
ncbi:MAG: STAS-like domain-containing protein [Parvibaculales bacterium]